LPLQKDTGQQNQNQNLPKLLKKPCLSRKAQANKIKSKFTNIAQNGSIWPKLANIAQNGPKWQKLRKIAQHGPKWPIFDKSQYLAEANICQKPIYLYSFVYYRAQILYRVRVSR
jgi:hypothetical protein